MESLFKLLLITHALAGGIALILGSLVMISRKGNKRHELLGNWFVYSVITNAICAFYLSVYHPNLFLFCLAMLSFYLVFTGKRFLQKSKATDLAVSRTIDVIANIALLLFGIILVIYSAQQSKNGQTTMIPMIFALFSIYLSIRPLYSIYSKKQTSKTQYLRAHIASMLGSYITIFSAFLVVNNHNYFPYIIGWFGPSALLVPLIFYWQNKYAKQR
jgi:uncharacterized membrane protein